MKWMHLFLLFTLPVFGQFSDDFSDGDFTNNPTWEGNTTKFEVFNEELHLQDALNESPAYLSTAVATKDSTIWEFYFRLDFDPSSNNQAKVYLASDVADLTGDLNGYYVKLGGVSNTVDRIQLFKQTGDDDELLVEGAESDAGISPTARVQVKRTDAGVWTLGYDLSGGTNYTFYGGDITDTEHEISAFMGVYCKYTSSNIDAFYFDDFSVNPTFVDDVAPELVSLEVVGNDELVLTFNEALDLDAAQNIANYTLTNLGNPDLAVLEVGNGNVVTLTFANSFPEEVNLTLTINGLQDVSGNVLNTTSDFFYNIANLYDVIITEIMANPTGALGLPEAEYIELLNTTENPINLKDWLFQDNSTTPKIIPEYTLGAGQYITLVDVDDAPLFDDLGVNVLPMDFPSITNDGELLQILSNGNNLIFSVEFAKTWYQNSSKADGGWSLEMINYNNPCGGMENWAASNNNRGGTPSSPNSILDITAIDNEPIELSRVGVVDASTIQLFFTESVNSEMIESQNFSIDNGIGNPLFIDVQLPDFQSVIMTLANPLSTGIIYTLTASNLQDCVGNGLGNVSSVQLALPEAIDSGDLVINEFLFDQATGNVDFLEIYNRSDKIVDLKKCRVLRASSNYQDLFLDPLQITKLITEDSYLLFPNEYVCLSSDQSLVKQQYFTENPENFIDVSGFPAYDPKIGAAIIQDSVGNELDVFVYRDSYHNDLVDVSKGVSLERIDFNTSSENPDNWHSASASVGYATPAYENSQYFNIPSLVDDFTVEPEVFSPDNDGYEEFTTISYTTDEPGFTANVYVYDDRGREINHLVKNELLGNQGFFKWNGDDANGDKANIGIYIFYIEMFDLNGEVQRFKKTVTVAGALD